MSNKRAVGFLMTVGIFTLLTPRIASAANTIGSTSPTALGTSTLTTSDPRDMVVKYPYAYIAGGNDGLVIMNITTPSAPTLTATIPTTCPASKLAVTDDHQYVYVACGTKMVVVGTFLKQVVFQYTDGPVSAVRIVGNRAYALESSDTFKGLRVFDITNAWQPSLIASYDVVATDFDVHTQFKYAYLLNAATGNVEIVDVGSTTVQSLGTYSGDPSFAATGIRTPSTSDSIAYLTSPTQGLRVLFVNGNRISVLGSYAGVSGTPGVRSAVVATTRYVTRKTVSRYVHEFVVAEATGLAVLRLSWSFAHPEDVSFQLVDRFAGSIAATAVDSFANGLSRYVLDVAAASGLATLDVFDANKVGTTVVTKVTGSKGSMTVATPSGDVTLTPVSRYTKSLSGYAFHFGNQLGTLIAIAPTGASRSSAVALYNEQGKLLKKVSPFGTSAKSGFRLSGVYDSIFDLTALSVINVGTATMVKIYNVQPNGVTSINPVRASTTTAKICGNFLSTTGGGSILATCADRKSKSLKVWKFNAQKATFVYQSSFGTKTLRISGNSVVYR